MNYIDLYNKAVAAVGCAYAPYSGFRVGAAVLTEDGSVFTGGNIENASYPVSICAERVAMSKAISEGHRRYKAIAIAAEREGVMQSASPCGMCRQFIMEFGGDIEVIFLAPEGETLVEEKISNLLTWGFNL